MQGPYYFITWKTYVYCLILQNFFKEALNTCDNVLEKFSSDSNAHKIPEELYSYKENLELALGGDSIATEKIVQTATDKIKNNSDWQLSET